MQVRAARLDELPYLQSRLNEKQTWEHVNLEKSIVFVAEDDSGNVIGFISGRLIWQAEPLLIFPEVMNSKRKGNVQLRRKAALYLLHALEGWLADRQQNVTGIYSYFAHFANRTTMKFGERLGFQRLHPGGRWYSKDV